MTLMTTRIHELLSELYPAHVAEIERGILELAAAHAGNASSRAGSGWSERDVWLITYPDQFQSGDGVPLASEEATGELRQRLRSPPPAPRSRS